MARLSQNLWLSPNDLIFRLEAASVKCTMYQIPIPHTLPLCLENLVLIVLYQYMTLTSI